MKNIGYEIITEDPADSKAEITESISVEAIQHVDSELNECGSQTACNLKSEFWGFDGEESHEIDEVHLLIAQAIRNGESKITLDIYSMRYLREKIEYWVNNESQEDYVVQYLKQYGFESA